MSHFNLKSLSFYGIAIGSVVILFNVVSVYGEANIKAPPAIGGRYRVTAQKLPDCLKSKPLTLTLQQSGVYLSGALSVADNTQQKEAAESDNHLLDGRWQNRQLNLSGSAPHLTGCNNPNVNIQATPEGKNLKGKMNLGSLPGTIDFTAQQDTSAQKQKSEH